MLFEKRGKMRPAAGAGGGGNGNSPSSALNRLSLSGSHRQRTLPGGRRYRCTPTLALATAVLALISFVQMRGYNWMMDDGGKGAATSSSVVDGGPPPSSSSTSSAPNTRGAGSTAAVTGERIEKEVRPGADGGPHAIPGPPAVDEEEGEVGPGATVTATEEDSPPSDDGDGEPASEEMSPSADLNADAGAAPLVDDSPRDESATDDGEDAGGSGDDGDGDVDAADEPPTEEEIEAEPQVSEAEAVVIDDESNSIVAETSGVGDGGHKKPTMKIEQISILGERNSGTRWTVSHVGKCFNHTLAVRERLVRHKHWFQDDTPLNTRFPRVGTLVIAQFRNPYHWVEAMRAVPHHAPKHYKLSWKEYVTTPWTMPRLPSDLAILKGNLTKLGRGETEIECQEYFTYNQITSCQVRPYPLGHFKKKPPYSGHQPQYELRNDGSGMPYGSILDLRADKIRNHLSVADWDWVQDLYSVRYEELLANGTAAMIRHIEEVTGVTAKCDPYPPQNRPKRPLGRDYVEWMTKFVDWEAEALVGYEPLKEGAGGAVKAKTKKAVKK